MAVQGNILKVIVIDNDILSLERFSDYLRMNPFISLEEHFPDTGNVISYLNDKRVDIIFIGIQVLVDEGFYWLSQLLKTDNDFVGIVFILSPNDSYLNNAIRNSGIAFVTRPIDNFQLNELIKQLFIEWKIGFFRRKHQYLLSKICQ
jgi:two-component SAPR family response regulator